MATYPTVDLSRFTPAVTTSASPSERAEQTFTPTPDLDAITDKALRTYPLWVGSSWVYGYLGFDMEGEYTWRIVETVVETQLVQGYYAARVERTVELQEGLPDADFPVAPEEGAFWLVLVEDQLYRLDSPDSVDPDTAWLELILSFSREGAVWYPDPDLRAMDTPSDDGLRTSSEPFQQALPMGGTYTCYSISTQEVDGISKGTFCDGVGFVYLEYIHTGQDYGYRAELTGFSLQ